MASRFKACEWRKAKVFNVVSKLFCVSATDVFGLEDQTDCGLVGALHKYMAQTSKAMLQAAQRFKGRENLPKNLCHLQNAEYTMDPAHRLAAKTTFGQRVHVDLLQLDTIIDRSRPQIQHYINVGVLGSIHKFHHRHNQGHLAVADQHGRSFRIRH